MRNLVAIAKRVLKDLGKNTQLLRNLIGSMPTRLQAVADLRCAATIFTTVIITMLCILTNHSRILRVMFYSQVPRADTRRTKFSVRR